jgi:xanthine/uracil/vitamin C permease (AzgA family)
MNERRQVAIACAIGLAVVFCVNLVWYGLKYSWLQGLMSAVLVTALTGVLLYFYWRLRHRKH